MIISKSAPSVLVDKLGHFNSYTIYVERLSSPVYNSGSSWRWTVGSSFSSIRRRLCDRQRWYDRQSLGSGWSQNEECPKTSETCEEHCLLTWRKSIGNWIQRWYDTLQLQLKRNKLWDTTRQVAGTSAATLNYLPHVKWWFLWNSLVLLQIAEWIQAWLN